MRNSLQNVVINTKRKQEKKGLDREKSAMVSVPSDALRTPLGLSKWYLEAIKKETRTTKTSNMVKAYINEVYKNNEQLLALVRNILSVSNPHVVTTNNVGKKNKRRR